MKTEKREYKVYAYSELSEEAKQKALEEFADINVDYYWYQVTIWEAKDRLEELGFEDTEITFSGFWSQGDGASFTAKVNLEKWLKVHKLAGKNKALLNEYRNGNVNVAIVKTSHQYEHEYTMGIDYDRYTDNEKALDQMNALEEKLLEDARDEARKIYKELENEYEYRTAKGSVEDTIIANEYEFLEDGKFFTL